MFRKLILAGLTMFLMGCSSVKYMGYLCDASFSPPKERTMVMEDGYTSTYFSIHKGKGKPDKIIFLISGSGYNSIKYYLKSYFSTLKGNYKIYALQKRFISSWTTEIFRKPSKQFNEHNYFDLWVKDQNCFINEILDDEENVHQKIIIFGVSEGGTTAAKVTTINDRISNLVIVGSGGKKFEEELRILIKNSGNDFNLDTIYTDIKENPNNIERTFYGHPYKYWNSVLFIDPMEFYNKIKIPILVAQGEHDKSTPIESGRFLRDEFNKRGNANLTFIEYKGADHTLINANGKEGLKDFFKKMNEWLK
jgi:pimeloyl-ACP methyl ester carboxylesterase